MNYVKTAVLLAGLVAFFVLVGRLVAGPPGILVGLALGLLMSGVSYFGCDRMVMLQSGAREVSPEECPRVGAIVRRLTERAGLPMPRLGVIPQEQPNAFATGRNPRHAVVCVTEGLLELMDDDELEGVLAHELGHVRNRDILVMTLVAAFAGAISAVAMIAQFSAYGGGGRDRDGRGGGNPLVLLLVALTAPLVAGLVQAMISRTREFAADRQGAGIAGSPEGLASALEKLGRAVPRRPWSGASTATAHLFIANPLSGGGLAGLFSSHPPIAERVARLRAMAA